MKMSELKEELTKPHLTTSVSQIELLERLGVPTGFGETSDEKWKREFNELQKSTKQADQDNKKKLKTLDPEDDPTHQDYIEKCCAAPCFPSWHAQTKPAGYFQYPNGSMIEVWRCPACGKIPARPNAPPIQEYDHDDNDDGCRSLSLGLLFAVPFSESKAV